MLGDFFFSDQKLHGFLEKLDAAANRLRPRLIQHHHADPRLAHPHAHDMPSANAHPYRGSPQGMDEGGERGGGKGGTASRHGEIVAG